MVVPYVYYRRTLSELWELTAAAWFSACLLGKEMGTKKVLHFFSGSFLHLGWGVICLNGGLNPGLSKAGPI